MVYSIDHPLLEHVDCAWFCFKTTINGVDGSQLLYAGQICRFLAHHKNLWAPNDNGADPPFAYDTFAQAFNSINAFPFKFARKGEDRQIAKGTDINEAAFDVGDLAIFDLSTAIEMVQHNGMTVQNHKDKCLFTGLMHCQVAIQLQNSREAEECQEHMRLNQSVVDNMFGRNMGCGCCGHGGNHGGHCAQQVIEDVLMAVRDYAPPAQNTPAVMEPAHAIPIVDFSLTPAPTVQSTPVASTPNLPASGTMSPTIDKLFDGKLEDFLDADLDAPGEPDEETVALSKSKETQRVC
ncbi:hypothetical protein E4T56_gene10294 [Termitomyces sp. T112]|nr:hypothetical protein E4T56_gene10294 [Termitomyces sp. T112]KAH0579827.1 hypothetical protein H2248_002655 [Termitomyces sp. 'cryptogamus']